MPTYSQVALFGPPGAPGRGPTWGCTEPVSLHPLRTVRGDSRTAHGLVLTYPSPPLCSDRAVSLACPDTQRDETGKVAPMLSGAPSLLLETPLFSHSPRSPLTHRGRLGLSHHVHQGARSALACPEGTKEEHILAVLDDVLTARQCLTHCICALGTQPNQVPKSLYYR